MAMPPRCGWSSSPSSLPRQRWLPRNGSRGARPSGCTGTDMLRVDVAKQAGECTLEASFASEGRVTGLFGASGAGKTSLINMIAGLLRPDRGVIALDDEVLDDTEKGVHVPPHRRRIGYVFQDARLFPHMNVAQNLGYGRRMNRLPDDP